MAICAAICENSSAQNTPVDVGRIDPSCRQRFLTEASEAWKKVTDDLKGFEVKLTLESLEYFDNQKFKPRQVRREWTYCVDDNSARKLVLWDNDGPYGVNERYHFDLHRDRSGVPFQLEECDTVNSENHDKIPGPLLPNRRLLARMVSIWAVPLETIVADQRFELIRAECGSDKNSNEVFTIAYRYRGERQQNPPFIPESIYWAELSPVQSWVVLRSGVDDIGNEKQKRRKRTEIRYQNWFRDTPFPKLILNETIDVQTGAVVANEKVEYETPRPIARQEGEYFLPHYGISEASVEVLTPKRSARVWVLVAAVIGLICAGALLWRAGRNISRAHW